MCFLVPRTGHHSCPRMTVEPEPTDTVGRNRNTATVSPVTAILGRYGQVQSETKAEADWSNAARGNVTPGRRASAGDSGSVRARKNQHP